MLGLGRSVIGACVVLAGCAGVLGFEDIVEQRDAVADAGPDTALPPVPDAAPVRRRCSPTAAVRRRTILSSLADTSFDGELWPRVTRNELTITFARFAKGGAPFFTSCFIATRAHRDEPFGAPRPLFADVKPPVRYAAPSPDGTRFYVAAEREGTGRGIFTAASEDAPLEILSAQGPGDRSQPTYNDGTRELFFAAAEPNASNRIRRRGGVGAVFGRAEDVDLFFEGPEAATTSYVEPVLSDDGLHLYYSTYRTLTDGGNPFGATYVVTRDTRGGFGDRQELRDLKLEEVRVGAISPDECRLYTYRLEGGVFRLFEEEREPPSD